MKEHLETLVEREKNFDGGTESAIFRAQEEIDSCISRAKAIADRLVSGEANSNDSSKANHKEDYRIEGQQRELQRLLKQDEDWRRVLARAKEKSEPLQYTTHSDVGYGGTKPTTTFNHIGYINPNLQGGK